MHHSRLFTTGLAVVLLAVAQFAAATPRDEVMQATSRMAAASSYVVHIDSPQTGAKGQIELQYAAPDRYRMVLPGGPTQTIIGNQAYMEMAGRTMRVPIPAGTLDRMQDQAHIRQAQDNAQIESLGADTVDGRPATRYRIIHPDQPGAEVTLWINADGWPLQMQVDGDKGTTTMRYSRFNDPGLVIAAPD